MLECQRVCGFDMGLERRLYCFGFRTGRRDVSANCGTVCGRGGGLEDGGRACDHEKNNHDYHPCHVRFTTRGIRIGCVEKRL